MGSSAVRWPVSRAGRPSRRPGGTIARRKPHGSPASGCRAARLWPWLHRLPADACLTVGWVSNWWMELADGTSARLAPGLSGYRFIIAGPRLLEVSSTSSSERRSHPAQSDQTQIGIRHGWSGLCRPVLPASEILALVTIPRRSRASGITSADAHRVRHEPKSRVSDRTNPSIYRGSP